MMSRSLFNGLAVICIVLCHLPSANATFWTVTSALLVSTSVSTNYLDFASSEYLYTFSETRTIRPGATPTKSAVSTSTYAPYTVLEVQWVLYPHGAVADSDLLPTTTTTTGTGQPTSTAYYIDLVYTAPASCTKSFTFSTSMAVFIPTEVTDQLTPARITTGTNSRGYTGYYADNEVTWFLPSTAVPFTTATEYYYSAYIAQCSKPYSFSDDSDSSSDSSDSDISVCYLYRGCTSLATWIIIIAAIIPSLFVLGFIESFIWYRRLMMGKSCLRFGTICWMMISLWVICFTRKQPSRSLEDQKALQQQWKSWSFGKRFKLWWKWGFRHRYPEALLGRYSRDTVGISPAQLGQPGMAGDQTYFNAAPPYEKNGTTVMQNPVPFYGPQHGPGQPAAQYPNTFPGSSPPIPGPYYGTTAPAGQGPAFASAQIPGQAFSPSDTQSSQYWQAPGQFPSQTPVVAPAHIPSNVSGYPLGPRSPLSVVPDPRLNQPRAQMYEPPRTAVSDQLPVDGQSQTSPISSHALPGQPTVDYSSPLSPVQGPVAPNQISPGQSVLSQQPQGFVSQGSPPPGHRP